MALLSFEMIVVLFWVHSIVGGLWLITHPNSSAPQFCWEIAWFYSQLAQRRTSFDFVEMGPIIYVGIEVNLLLLKLDCTIVDCKPMPTKELSPGCGLDCKAE